MDIASVFEWFAQETAHIAEQANEVRRRETLGKLALLWAAAAAEQRNKQRARRASKALSRNVLASRYRSGRSPDWLKLKNPAAPAVKHEAEEDWGR